MQNEPTPLHDLTLLCNQFETISLKEMKSIQLMNRIDTKYITNKSQLVQLLSLAKTHYRMQCIDGATIAAYDTIYFDTPNYDMYLRHHNGRLTRQKIRTRTYLDSCLSFLEIKNKNNKGRTHKVRIAISANDFYNFSSNAEALDLLHSYSSYPMETLEPALRTRFNRITLVNNEKSERLTIDFNLSFENQHTHCIVAEPNLVIIELKQDGYAQSQMKEILKELRIKIFKISKYCIGTALTNPLIKQNRFKQKLHTIAQVTTQQ